MHPVAGTPVTGAEGAVYDLPELRPALVRGVKRPKVGGAHAPNLLGRPIILFLPDHASMKKIDRSPLHSFTLDHIPSKIDFFNPSKKFTNFQEKRQKWKILIDLERTIHRFEKVHRF